MIQSAVRTGDRRAVEDTGTRFLQVADQNPAAWPAVQEYLSYRSFLNSDSVPRVAELVPVPAITPATGTSKYRTTVSITALPPHSGHFPAFEVFFAGGYASGDKSARLELLSNPQPEGSEFAYFIINGGEATIGLDGEYMRNVIIRNCDVSYSGGPVRLENVWFVNCVFHSYRHVMPESRKLGKVILAYAPVTVAVGEV